MATAPAPRKRNNAGAPAPSRAYQRMERHERWTHPHILDFLRSTWRTTKLYILIAPVRVPKWMWRHRDAVVASLPIFVTFIWGFWWAALATPFCWFGWRALHGRCDRIRMARAWNRRLRRTVERPPRVSIDGIRDIYSPQLPAVPRDKIRVGELVVDHPLLTEVVDHFWPQHPPRELIASNVPLGIPSGMREDDYMAMQETIANSFRQHTVMTRRPRVPGIVDMRVEYIDWLARVAPWTLIDDLTPYNLPIGFDRNALTVTASIADQAWLIAGARDSGKSAFLCGILGRLVHIPRVELYIIDPLGGVDLSDFYDFPCTKRVATSPVEAKAVAAEFDSMNQKQFQEMANAGLKKLRWPDAIVRLLVVEEYGAIYNDPDIQRYIRNSATQGRKSLHSILLATQFPRSDILETVTRGQFTNRLCLKVQESGQSLVVLGCSNPDASKISGDHRGRGYWQVGTDIREVRTFGLFDDDLSWLKSVDPRYIPDPEPIGPPPEDAPPPFTPRLVPDLRTPPRQTRDSFQLICDVVRSSPEPLEPKQIAERSGVPLNTVYNHLKKPCFQVVRAVNPKTYRMRKSA